MERLGHRNGGVAARPGVRHPECQRHAERRIEQVFAGRALTQQPVQVERKGGVSFGEGGGVGRIDDGRGLSGEL
jgi:hypothetical protein